MRVWAKKQIVRKFWENFENFRWKFYRKMEFLFYFYFGKFVTKNRAFGNNTFLYNIFSVSGGGGFPPFPPGYALAWKASGIAIRSYQRNDFVMFSTVWTAASIIWLNVRLAFITTSQIELLMIMIMNIIIVVVNFLEVFKRFSIILNSSVNISILFLFWETNKILYY